VRSGTHNVVVNQVLFPKQGCRRDLWSGTQGCKLREAQTSLRPSREEYGTDTSPEIFELYEDFHVVLMPLLDNEVRGVS
jgi:arsenite-transporting ATPase